MRVRLPRRRPRLPIGLAIFAGLVALLVRFLLSEPTLTYALESLEERLHDELGLTLVVAHIEAEAQSARVTMGPVVLKGTDGQVLFAADQIVADLAPLKFFERRLKVEHLEIDNPKVNLRVVDGKIAGVRAPESQSKDPLFRVDVSDFQLHDGSFDLAVTSKDKNLVHAHLGGIEMRLRDRGRDEHRLRFTVKQSEVHRPLAEGGEDVLATSAFGGRIVVHGDGLLSPSRIDVSDVTVDADDSEVSVAGDVVLGSAGLAPAFDADLSARANLATALTHLHLGLPIKGNANVTAHVSARPGGEELVASGQLDTSNVDVDNLHLGSGRARFRVDTKQIEVEQASWDWADTTIHGQATVALDDSFHTSVKANAGTFTIYGLMRDMGVPGAWADAKIDGHADVSGTLKPLLLEGKGGGIFTDILVASMDVRKSDADHIVLHVPHPVVAKEVGIRVDADGLKFDGAVDDGFTRAAGTFQVFYDTNKGLLIDAESDQADFTSVDNHIADLQFNGVGRGHMHVQGPQSGPVLTAELEIGGFALEDFAFGDATGRVHLFKNELRFEDVVANKNGRSRYGGLVALTFGEWPDVRGESHRGPKLDIDLGFDPAQAEDLRAVIPAKYTTGVLSFLREDLDVTGPVRGRFAASGAVGGGTFDHMTGGGKLDLLDGAALLDQHMTGSGAFHMDLDKFYVDALDVNVGAPRPDGSAARGVAHAEASVGRADAVLAGAVSAKGVLLSDIDQLKDASKPFSGSFDVDGKLGRSAHDPGFIGRAQVHAARYGNVPIGDADVSLDHAGRVLTMKGALLSSRGDGVVHVETRSPFNYDAAVAVSEGPLAPLLPSTLMPDGVGAVVQGDVEARGALKTFRDSRGSVALKKASVSARGLALNAKGGAAAHFHGTRLTFDQLDLVDADNDLVSLRGLIADDALDLSASGNGKLSLLPKVWPKIESADGRFSFDVAVTGDLDHASMSGQGLIQNGKLAVNGSFPALDDVDAQVAFRGPNVVIERMTAKADGAPISAQGAVTLDGSGPRAYDLEAKYSKLKLHVPAQVESVSSGRLVLKGDAALPTLSGEVRVQSARYTEDINWERLLPDLRRRGSALASLSTGSEAVRFDVHLIADRGIVVDNNVLDLEAKGDLFLTGTEERPGLKGGIQLIRGNATFRGNRYRLARGTVDFVDTYRIMPVLDVEAETRVHDYDVSAHLSGPAQAPAIDLSSRPELSEIDIVSLLTFGFTQYEVRDVNGSAGAAGLEVVSAYTGLDKELRRVLPEAVRKSSALQLDELRLTSQFSNRAGASVPAVALGMEVNPGLWGVDGSRLRLQSTLVDPTGSGTEQRVEWEKRFDSNVRLRLSWTSDDTGTCPSCTNQWGDLGGDVWYRWEF